VRVAVEAKSSTRDRILSAAAVRFSRYSYEETGLRDIAADVGVDVAYVHRSFGSKERLFAEALKSTVRPDRILAGSATELPGRFADELFPNVGRRDVAPDEIITRSLSSPEASRVLREAILRDYVLPLAKKLDDKSMRRAALVAAFLAGVGIFRNVLCIDPLIDDEVSEIKVLIASAITIMIGRRHRANRTAPSRKRLTMKKNPGVRALTNGERKWRHRSALPIGKA
jgi:AcrR family transcriptional regulator